jgi:hypothetical protein
MLACFHLQMDYLLKKIPPNHLYVLNQMTFFITNQMDACLFPFTIGFSAGKKIPPKLSIFLLSG